MQMFVKLYCIRQTIVILPVLILIYLLTVIGLTPGGNSTVQIYTQTIHRTTQLTTLVVRLSGIGTQSGHVEFLSLCDFNQN